MRTGSIAYSCSCPRRPGAIDTWVVLRLLALVAFSFCVTSTACSSNGATPVYCDPSEATTDNLSHTCDCEFLTANKGNKSPNNVACTAALLGPGAICSLSPSTTPGVDTGCACFSFDCAEDEANPEVVCGYWLRQGADPKGSFNLKHAEPSACVGAHHCLAPWGSEGYGGLVCACQDAPCPSGAKDLTSCTDSTAQGLLRAGETFATDIPVTDCANMASTLPGE